MFKILFLFLLLMPLKTFAIGCPTNKYPFLCRGPVTVSQQAWVVFDGHHGGTLKLFFNNNRQKAGPFGEYLKPGACAWEDRATTAEEPNFAVLQWEGIEQLWVTQNLQNCLANSNCVVEACAGNEKLTNWEPPINALTLPHNWLIELYYPIFK